ncbi:MAG: TonB-dependent receptor [Alistipes sp.]
MKRIFLFSGILALSMTATASAQNGTEQPDSTAMIEIQQVEVTATRAKDHTPTVRTDLSHEQIARGSYALDIPSLLALTPSMIATNETGIGIGGTSIRLRGTDATRLNVTVNGVPVNNPDSHSVYWYDTPDLLSSVGSIQIQRGAGTSTNGTGAFGGAINMTTESLSPEFGGSASLSYGSYNTTKQSVNIHSGLLRGHWIVDARLSHIGSDGYIERGATDLKSYMLQGAYYNAGTMVKLISFGGKARTYLTYNGVSKEDMALYGRRYHTSGQYVTDSGPYVLADGTHVAYYDDQTDNYLQINNQLLVSHRFNERWALNATLFYTYGYGFYRQYKDDAWLQGYDNLDIGIAQSDLIRRKIMRNHTGGVNAAGQYTSKSVDLVFGGSWSIYACPHWGELAWVDEATDASLYNDKRWYDNDVRKHDANLFAKINWNIAKGLYLYGDVQYRYVHYKSWGVNDNYNWTTGAMQPVDVNEKYHFFNPHVGLNYEFAKHHAAYFSFAVAHKEPTRSDFTDRYLFSGLEGNPKAERLLDYELGYRFKHPVVDAGINLYYMSYRNQLVHTGLTNEGGDNLNINVPDSYRRGIELTLAVRPAKWFTFGANATFSQNRIENYTENIDGKQFDMGTRTIAYSPNVIAGAVFDFHVKGFAAVLQTQYVGKQYLTNGNYDDLTLDRYCVTNLDLSYTLQTRRIRSVRFGVALYNLFNTEYCSNGYGGSWLNGDTLATRGSWACYFPQAPLNVLANVTLNF